MKRIIPILLVLILMLGLMAGCGKEAPAAPATPAAPAAPAAPSDPAKPAEPAAPAEPAVEAVHYTLNITGPANVPFYDQFVTFADKLYELSGGTMIVDINALGNMYGEKFALEDLPNNTVDITYLSCSPASATVKEVAYGGMPGTFRYDENDPESYLRFAEYIAPYIEACYADYNIKWLGLRPAGRMALMNTQQPVLSSADLGNMVWRVSGTWLSKLMDAWDANTTSIPISELAVGMERGTCQGALTGVEQTVTNSLYESINHISIFDEVDGFGSLVCSYGFWNSLTDEQKGWVEEAAWAYTEQNLAVYQENTEGWLKTIEESGVEIVWLTPEQQNEFMEGVWEVHSELDEVVNENGIAFRDALYAWRDQEGY